MMVFDVDSAALVQVQATELIAQATVGQAGPGSTLIKVSKTLWSAQTVEQEGGSHSGDGDYAKGRIISPARASLEDLASSGWLQLNGINSSAPKAIATIETAPKQGRLETMPDGEFKYTPNKDFLGKEFVSFIVDVEGRRTRRNYELHVVKNIEDIKGQNSAPADTEKRGQARINGEWKKVIYLKGLS